MYSFKLLLLVLFRFISPIFLCDLSFNKKTLPDLDKISLIFVFTLLITVMLVLWECCMLFTLRFRVWPRSWFKRISESQKYEWSPESSCAIDSPDSSGKVTVGF